MEGLWSHIHLLPKAQASSSSLTRDSLNSSPLMVLYSPILSHSLHWPSLILGFYRHQHLCPFCLGSRHPSPSPLTHLSFSLPLASQLQWFFDPSATSDVSISPDPQPPRALTSITLKSRGHHYSPSCTYILDAFTLFWSGCVHLAQTQSWSDPNPHSHQEVERGWRKPHMELTGTPLNYWWPHAKGPSCPSTAFPLLDIMSHFLPFPWASSTTSIILSLSWWPCSPRQREDRRLRRDCLHTPPPSFPSTLPWPFYLPPSCHADRFSVLQAHLVHAARDHILSHQHEDIILVIFSGITNFSCFVRLFSSIYTHALTWSETSKQTKK